jgi:hypothetical protein
MEGDAMTELQETTILTALKDAVDRLPDARAAAGVVLIVDLTGPAPPEGALTELGRAFKQKRAVELEAMASELGYHEIWLKGGDEYTCLYPPVRTPVVQPP